MRLSDDAISTIRDLIDYSEFHNLTPEEQYSNRLRGVVRITDVTRLKEELLRYEYEMIKFTEINVCPSIDVTKLPAGQTIDIGGKLYVGTATKEKS